MFVEEARVVSELQHPNIVQIHDFGRDERGSYFLVMEWVEGTDLASWYGAHTDLGRPTPWGLVTAIGIEVLRGLSAAHERRVLGKPAPVFHRDVTPHNILIGENGVVKLADFGLARAMDRAKMTRPDIVKGKIAYLAPELTFGSEASVLTDLFGMGVVLWEALAGRRLFAGRDNMETVRHLREGDVSHLSALRSDVPPQLFAIVYRALAKDPQHRFQSARDMTQALTRLLRTVPESMDDTMIGTSVVRVREHLSRGSSHIGSAATEPHAGAADTPVSGSASAEIPLTQKKV
jgi:serine/threonine-protein kinase